jgi:hypothetical protein
MRASSWGAQSPSGAVLQTVRVPRESKGWVLKVSLIKKVKKVPLGHTYKPASKTGLERELATMVPRARLCAVSGHSKSRGLVGQLHWRYSRTRSAFWTSRRNPTVIYPSAEVVTPSRIFASHPSPQMIRVRDLRARPAASLLHTGPPSSRRGHRAGLQNHFVRRATRPRGSEGMLGVDGGIGTMAAAQATCTQGAGSAPESRRIVRWAALPSACFAAEALHAVSCANTALHCFSA